MDGIRLICKECGEPRKVGRRLCNKCNVIRSKKYYNLEKRRKRDSKLCLTCGEIKYFSGKKQVECSDCRKKRLTNKATNNYLYNEKAKPIHRVIAEKLIGRSLKYNEIVHHINENPKDNRLENLILLTRSNHGKLHIHLLREKALHEQGNGLECGEWSEILESKNLEWLIENGVEFLRLSDI